MFDQLSERLDGILSKIKGRGYLTEKDVDEGLREVRLALLEADVHFKVVKDFIAKVREKAIGQKVLESLNPGHQIVKIVKQVQACSKNILNRLEIKGRIGRFLFFQKDSI